MSRKDSSREALALGIGIMIPLSKKKAVMLQLLFFDKHYFKKKQGFTGDHPVDGSEILQ